MFAMSVTVLAFWSPNFDRRDEERGKDDADSTFGAGDRRSKHPEPCRTMQALQRGLSEAQRLNFGVDVIQHLIRMHKSDCLRCRQPGDSA